MGALLGGGIPAYQAAQPAEAQSSDVLSGLMGALLGGGAAQQPSQAAPDSQESGGFDLSTLLTAGAAYIQASQHGASPTEALIQAVMSGSQMNNTPHHSQSGHLVTSTLINALGSMLGGKK